MSSQLAIQPTHLEVELKWGRQVTKEDFLDQSRCPPTPQSIFQLQRFIERQYQNLPWPSQLQAVTVMTNVAGGRGDISAAAKVIGVLQKICPSLLFEWVVLTNKHDPQSFLKGLDLSKIKIRTPLPMPLQPTKTDFLVVGPVKNCWGTDYIETKFRIDLKGPRFDFLENAETADTEDIVFNASKMVRDEEIHDELYRKVHKYYFSTHAKGASGLVMGLQKGSGVFLDENRMKAPLSRGDCCPSYLLLLEDQLLKQDILSAMGADTFPDYDKNSLNFGYAHRPVSWAKFIDFVALHEKDKNVTIVLNQVGEFDRFSTEEFCQEILTAQRLTFLKKLGYGTVTVKGVENPFLIQHESGGRKLTIIVRPSFKPNDMKQLQLASERLLATGDNTAAEAWAARCKLYVYEDVANGGCKREFLQQQIELASTISLSLSRLLDIFGTKNELSDEATEILKNPALGEETLQFCNLITKNYSFKEVLEGALKRVAWLHAIPELIDLEADTIDNEFKMGFINFLKDVTNQSQIIKIKNIPIIREKIESKIQESTHF